MHGIEGFAEVIKTNSSMILESLTSEDKDQIYALLPKTESIEQSEVILKDLLTCKLPLKFGQTPLDSFATRLQEGRFTEKSIELRNCEELLSLVQQRDRVLQQLKAIEAQETKEDSDENNNEVLNMLFKTEHSKIYLEDFGQVQNQVLSSSEESGYDDELMDS